MKVVKKDILGFTLMQLMHAHIYLGYDKTYWDFRIRSFLLGVKNKSYIFNLNYTMIHLRNALSFVFNLSLKKGICALINENPAFRSRLSKKFELFMYPIEPSSILRDAVPRGVLTSRLLKDRVEELFGCMPNVFVFTSPSFSETFIYECATLKIPTVVVADTAWLPLPATYKIPGNEKSYRGVVLYTTLFYLTTLKGFLTRSNLFFSKAVQRYKRHRWRRVFDLEGEIRKEWLLRKKQRSMYLKRRKEIKKYGNFNPRRKEEYNEFKLYYNKKKKTNNNSKSR